MPHDQSASRGAAGTDRTIDQARVDPLGGRDQHHHHTAPHADTQGAVGREEDVGAARIAPLDGGAAQQQRKNPGLDDEIIDGARTQPLGSVREPVV